MIEVTSISEEIKEQAKKVKELRGFL